MNRDTLLLTGTITPSKEQEYATTSLITETRKLQYLKSILFYITESNFTGIVFCENSDYRFNVSELNNINYLSKLYNKKVELLHFKGNSDMVNKYGYGYGEGECIDYALDNSKILEVSKTFYKITGRYIIGNINIIVNKHSKCNNIFIRDIPAFFELNTGFFKIDKELYKQLFYNAKKFVNHGNKMNFETVLYSILYKNNYFKINEKLKILPYRINCYDDKSKGIIKKFHIMRRSLKWYDFLLVNLGIYNISSYEKILFKLITPFTRGGKM